MTWHLATNAQTVVAGEQALETVPIHLQILGLHRAAIIASPSVAGTDSGALLDTALAGVTVTARHTAHAHSPLAATQAIAADLREVAPDVLVAVGGGSAIDTAKAVALLLDDRPLDIQLGPAAPILPIAAIPTTLAGAELTPAGALTDGGVKRLFVNRGLAATIAVYDPRMLRDVPAGVLASTGMNGLAHCLEAAYSLGSNPVARALASSGTAAFASALAALGGGAHSASVLEDLQSAAVLGGLAIASGSAGIHHAVCHVLGGTYGLPHGAANAAFLPYALEYNAEVTGPTQHELWRAMATGGFSIGADLPARVNALREHLGLAGSLADLGIDRDDLPSIATATLEDPTSGFNPRVATGPDDLLTMLDRAWVGELQGVAS